MSSEKVRNSGETKAEHAYTLPTTALPSAALLSAVAAAAVAVAAVTAEATRSNGLESMTRTHCVAVKRVHRVGERHLRWSRGRRKMVFDHLFSTRRRPAAFRLVPARVLAGSSVGRDPGRD